MAEKKIKVATNQNIKGCGGHQKTGGPYWCSVESFFIQLHGSHCKATKRNNHKIQLTTENGMGKESMQQRCNDKNNK